MQPWTVLIASHAFFAAVSLLLGGFQLARRTRGDRWHVLVGRIWAISMLATSFPSFWIGGYSTPMELFLKFLAVVSIVSVCIGWWALRRGDLANHAGFMTGAYLGLVAAFVGVVAVPDRRIPSAFRLYPEQAFFVTAAVIAIVVSIVAVTRVVARAHDQRVGQRQPSVPGADDATG